MQGRHNLIPNQQDSVDSTHQPLSDSNDPFASVRQSRRAKERFYVKYDDYYVYSFADQNEKGCLLHFTDKLPKDVITYPNSSYVYSTKSKSLIYIFNGVIENVRIDDFLLLQLKITRMMNTSSKKYDYKLLSYQQIYSLITTNGGHKPLDIPDNEMSKISFGLDREDGHENIIDLNRDLTISMLEKAEFMHRTSNRIENLFYEKNRNIYGCEEFEINLNTTSMLFYIENQDSFCHYDVRVNDYIFINELLALYVVSTDKLARIKIDNMKEFMLKFLEIMDTPHYKYDCKFISTKLIQQLILSCKGILPTNELQKNKNILKIDVPLSYKSMNMWSQHEINSSVPTIEKSKTVIEEKSQDKIYKLNN